MYTFDSDLSRRISVPTDEIDAQRITWHHFFTIPSKDAHPEFNHEKTSD